MADAFDEDGHLGVEGLIVRVEVLELGEQPGDDVVLLDALEDVIVGFGICPSKYLRFSFENIRSRS